MQRSQSRERSVANYRKLLQTCHHDHLMHPASPTLADLPRPAQGRTGWPWTESPKVIEKTLPDGAEWPRISIVTPSFNQANYLEETLRSVLLQGYPNLEYIVIDGASTDGSSEIIRRYEPWLSYWMSARDSGQAQALNHGFERTSGTLLGSINSDDLLEPGVLRSLALAHQAQSNAILLGDVINFDARDGASWRIRQRNVNFDAMSQPWRRAVTWHQPGTWFPRSLYQRVGPYDETLRYLFDWDWMCRALRLAPVRRLNEAVARFRYHAESKTVGEAESWRAERATLIRRYWPHQTCDAKLLHAILEFASATDKMVYQSYDRRAAVGHLVRALGHDQRLLALPRYWIAWGKILLPQTVAQRVRVLLKGF